MINRPTIITFKSVFIKLRQPLKKALKATLLLSPLLGMTYVIFLVNPNTDPETSGYLNSEDK